MKAHPGQIGKRQRSRARKMGKPKDNNWVTGMVNSILKGSRSAVGSPRAKLRDSRQVGTPEKAHVR